MEAKRESLPKWRMAGLGKSVPEGDKNGEKSKKSKQSEKNEIKSRESKSLRPNQTSPGACSNSFSHLLFADVMESSTQVVEHNQALERPQMAFGPRHVHSYKASLLTPALPVHDKSSPKLISYWQPRDALHPLVTRGSLDRKSTRLNSSHAQ